MNSHLVSPPASATPGPALRWRRPGVDAPAGELDGPAAPRRRSSARRGAAAPGPTAAPAPQPDTAALVARCLAGDAAAWTALVQRYQRLVHAVVRRIGLDEHGAADVFQTVFARLVQHLPRIADPSRLQAWIVTTAKREALLQRERSRRTVSMSRSDESGEEAQDWDLADDSPRAEQMLDELQQLDRVRCAMDRLDAPSRELLLLLFRDEEDKLSYDEIARRLAIPVGSIGPTRARALAKLRRLMA